MSSIRFIHAADIHLGRPFSGLGRSSPELGDLFRGAHYHAWDTIVKTAVDLRVDFVTLGGDVFDSATAGVRARVAFRNGVQQLHDASIPVFMALGNHDPLATFPKSLQELPGLHIFGHEPEGIVPGAVEQTQGVMLYGTSFPRSSVGENLVVGFHRDPGLDLAIGVVHANVSGIGGHRDYAPCTLDDLKETGMDVWCLGHVHAPMVLCHSPLIIYPGTPQGAQINENGPHGCYLVTVNDSAESEARFISTAPVWWVSTEVDVTESLSAEDVLDAIETESSRLCDEDRPPAAIVARISLTGSTSREIIGPFTGDEEMSGLLAERLAMLPTPVYPESVHDLTDPLLDMESLMDGEGLLSDFLRLCSSTPEDPHMLEQLVREVRTDLLRKVTPSYIMSDSARHQNAVDAKAWADLLNGTGKTVAQLFADSQSDTP